MGASVMWESAEAARSVLANGDDVGADLSFDAGVSEPRGKSGGCRRRDFTEARRAAAFDLVAQRRALAEADGGVGRGRGSAVTAESGNRAASDRVTTPEPAASSRTDDGPMSTSRLARSAA